MIPIIRVFPRRTSLTPCDDWAFVGSPPLLRPLERVDEIHVSVTFTWDIAEGEYLRGAWSAAYPNTCVKLGGPAIVGGNDGVFQPGMYIKQGVTFTTTGCNNDCPWCLVREREGRLVELDDFASGYIIQDNNILQASRKHLDRVAQMLNAQNRAAKFSGGLDVRSINAWSAEWLRGIRISEVFLAADTKAALVPLERAIKRLWFLSPNKLRVYALLAYGDETIDEATARLETIWELGGMPFAQLYQPADQYIEYSAGWRRLARQWSRPAIMKRMHNLPVVHCKPLQFEQLELM